MLPAVLAVSNMGALLMTLALPIGCHALDAEGLADFRSRRAAAAKHINDIRYADTGTRGPVRLSSRRITGRSEQLSYVFRSHATYAKKLIDIRSWKVPLSSHEPAPRGSGVEQADDQPPEPQAHSSGCP